MKIPSDLFLAIAKFTYDHDEYDDNRITISELHKRGNFLEATNGHVAVIAQDTLCKETDNLLVMSPDKMIDLGLELSSYHIQQRLTSNQKEFPDVQGLIDKHILFDFLFSIRLADIPRLLAKLNCFSRFSSRVYISIDHSTKRVYFYPQKAPLIALASCPVVTEGTTHLPLGLINLSYFVLFLQLGYLNKSPLTFRGLFDGKALTDNPIVIDGLGRLKIKGLLMPVSATTFGQTEDFLSCFDSVAVAA